ESADAVARAFIHEDVDERLPLLPIDDQRIAKNSEIDVAARAVEIWNVLGEIRRVLLVVELARSRPENPFGFDRHRRNDVTIRNTLVAVYANAGNGESPAFIDL